MGKVAFKYADILKILSFCFTTALLLTKVISFLSIFSSNCSTYKVSSSNFLTIHKGDMYFLTPVVVLGGSVKLISDSQTKRDSLGISDKGFDVATVLLLYQNNTPYLGLKGMIGEFIIQSTLILTGVLVVQF